MITGLKKVCLGKNPRFVYQSFSQNKKLLPPLVPLAKSQT